MKTKLASAAFGQGQTSLRILPAMGAVLVVALMLAERAGLPASLFTQLFLIVVAVTVGGIALGTRTLGGKQFFRPSSGGQAVTRGTAIAGLTGLGVLPVALSSLWKDDPTFGLSVALAVALGGLLFVAFTAPALDKTDAADLPRLAIPDASSPWLRAAVYLVALATCLSALGAVAAYFQQFELHQGLVADSFITRGAIGLALLVAILGGRAGIVRLTALALPVALLAGAGVAAIGVGLELTALRELSSSELLSAAPQAQAGIAWQNVVGFCGIGLMTCALLGTVLGNAGAGSRQAVLRSPLPFFIAMGGSILVAASLAALLADDAISSDFAIYSVASELGLPIVFRSAGVAAIAVLMCASISALLFACASIVLRGLAPIFTQRRQADGRQLFRARLLMLALGAVLIFYPPQVDLFTMAQLAAWGAAAMATMCLPLTAMPAGSRQTSGWQIAVAWLAGLGVLAGGQFVPGGLVQSALMGIAALCTLSTAVTLAVLWLFTLVSRLQARNRATI